MESELRETGNAKIKFKVSHNSISQLFLDSAHKADDLQATASQCVLCASKCVCGGVCVSYLSLEQLSPIAVREASVMLLQPDTHKICSLWHPRHKLTRPSSVIC